MRTKVELNNRWTRQKPDHVMKAGAIISRGESLQILKNDLRKLALEKRAAELNDASTEKREEILAEIERNVQKEVLRRASTVYPDTLLF